MLFFHVNGKGYAKVVILSDGPLVDVYMGNYSVQNSFHLQGSITFPSDPPS